MLESFLGTIPSSENRTSALGRSLGGRRLPRLQGLVRARRGQGSAWLTLGASSWSCTTSSRSGRGQRTQGLAVCRNASGRPACDGRHQPHPVAQAQWARSLRVPEGRPATVAHQTGAQSTNCCRSVGRQRPDLMLYPNGLRQACDARPLTNHLASKECAGSALLFVRISGVRGHSVRRDVDTISAVDGRKIDDVIICHAAPNCCPRSELHQHQSLSLW